LNIGIIQTITYEIVAIAIFTLYVTTHHDNESTVYISPNIEYTIDLNSQNKIDFLFRLNTVIRRNTQHGTYTAVVSFKFKFLEIGV